MTAARVIFLSTVAALLFACGKKTDPETEAAEYTRRLKADSIQAIVTADSLFALADTVEGPGKMLKQPSIRKSKDESYRLTAEFSFGQSPVGPLLSVMAQERDSRYLFVTISFPEPERKRTEVIKEISKDDFVRIGHYFDSINFHKMPTVLLADYQVVDATQYYVESVKDGIYHRISRTKPIERTIYDVWVEVLTIAKFDPKVIEMFREMSDAAK